MTNETQIKSIDVVKAFYDTLQEHDEKSIAKLLKEDVIFEIPLSATGDPKPSHRFDGKKETMKYIAGAIANFSRLIFIDKDFTASADGQKVFVTANGDLIKREGNVPYHNVYVYIFALEGNLIRHVHEYANPVTFSKLMNLPIG